MPKQPPAFDLRAAIADVPARYCRGVDRGDEALVRPACFDDAIDDHGGYVGSVEGFLDHSRQRVAGAFESTHHQLGQTFIRAEGDAAFVGTCFTAHHILLPKPGAGGREVMVLGGRYVDRFERRRGTCLIARRTVIRDWCEVRPMVPHHLPMREGQRGSEDSSYSEEARLLG
jgi:hypothetical protein